MFVDMLGVGILIPVFPQLINPASPDNILPAGWTMAQGAVLLGWLSAAYPLAQFFAAPIMGQLADRFGRKPVLAISIFGTAVGYALFALGLIIGNIPLLFVSRILDGITGGNASVAQAAIADISTPKNRAKNFGLIGMAFGLGFILGPYLGGKLADPNLVGWFNVATPFWVAAGIALVNCLMILLFLPETLKLKIKERIDLARPIHNIAAAFSRPGLRSVMPTSFLFMAGFTFFTTFFGVILLAKFGFTSSNMADYFAYLGLWIAIVQGALTGIVAKKYKDYQVLRISLFISALSLLAYGLVPDGAYKWLFLIPPFMSIGNGLTMAFSSSLISRVSPKDLQGQAMGINTSVMALAQGIPAILSGYVYSMNQNITVFVASFLVALAGIAFWVLFRPGRDDALAAPSGAQTTASH